MILWGGVLYRLYRWRMPDIQEVMNNQNGMDYTDGITKWLYREVMNNPNGMDYTDGIDGGCQIYRR